MEKLIITSESTNNEFSPEANTLELVNYDNRSLGAMLDKFGIEYNETEVEEGNKEAYEVDPSELPSLAQINQAITSACEAATWVDSEDKLRDFVANFNEGDDATYHQEDIIRGYFSDRI